MSIDPGAVTARLFDVRERRAVVTGAASGLGLAVAEVLADCGARVTLADVDAERLESVAGELGARGCEVRTAVVDVTDDASVRAAFDGVVAAYGGVDIVFANAGIAAAGSATFTVLPHPTLTKSFTPNNVAPNAPAVLTLTLGNTSATPVTAPEAFTLVTLSCAALPNEPPCTVRRSLTLYPLPPAATATAVALVTGRKTPVKGEAAANRELAA